MYIPVTWIKKKLLCYHFFLLDWVPTSDILAVSLQELLAELFNMNVKACLEVSETLLSVHITKCISWWKSLRAMLLFPFKDVEAYVLLVLWHLYVFKDMQSPSIRELFSAQEMISKSQNMWTCGCLPVPSRQGIFPLSSVPQLIMFCLF